MPARILNAPIDTETDTTVYRPGDTVWVRLRAEPSRWLIGKLTALYKEGSLAESPGLVMERYQPCVELFTVRARFQPNEAYESWKMLRLMRACGIDEGYDEIRPISQAPPPPERKGKKRRAVLADLLSR